MEKRVIMASKFKEQCLALIDQVSTNKISILVTKRGRPMARLVPLEEPSGRPTMGSVTLLCADDESATRSPRTTTS